MLLSSLNTGNTDLRDTEVQQPNTAATLSLVMSSRAFSAKSGQFEAGSTTTASSFLPSRPPFLLMSSTIIRMVSLSVVSLIAIVPDSECKAPILIVPGVWALAVVVAAAATNAAPTSAARQIPCKIFMAPSFSSCAAFHGRQDRRSKIEAKPRQRFAAFGGKRLFLGHAYFMGKALPFGSAHSGRSWPRLPDQPILCRPERREP